MNIQVLYVTLLLLAVLYFIHRKKRKKYQHLGYLLFMCLRNRLEEVIRIGRIETDSGSVSFWFRSEFMMDQILNEIRRVGEKLKYDYVPGTFELTLATFSLEAPGERFKFRLHCQPSSQNSVHPSVYCLLLV